jgi:hypothetical protein
MLATTGLLAQDPPPAYAPQAQDQPRAWRRADPSLDHPSLDHPSLDQPTPDQGAQGPGLIADQAGAPGNPNQDGPPPPPNFSANQSANQAVGQPPNQQGGYAPPMRQQPMRQQPMRPDNVAVPAQLTIRPGTFVSIRMNQGLSSDHSQQGDTFFATLAQPLIVDGVVVAQRGETVMGRVTEAQKAGRVEGTSRLGLELTGLTLVDGQQLPIQSQMINRNGQTSVGRDVGAVAGTTALGAAIGAGADLGRGAAIGAGAGAAAGLLGVLLTRGRPTIVYPESVLTFRVSTAATVATDRAPQAFRYVENGDYNRGGYSANVAPRPVGPAPPPYYYGQGYYPYPYYGGPGFSLYFGPSYYGYRGGFYYRGGRRW